MPPIKVSRHGGCPGAFRASQQHRICVKSSSRASFQKKEGPGVAFFGDGQHRRSLSPSFKGVALTMELHRDISVGSQRWVTRMAKNCDRLNLATSPSQPTLNLREHGGCSISTATAPGTSLFLLELRARDTTMRSSAAPLTLALETPRS